MKKKYQICFKSNPTLDKTIISVDLSLTSNQLIFQAVETENYDWINWLMVLPENESVTIHLLDKDSKTKCFLLIEGLYIDNHKCSLSVDHQSDSYSAMNKTESLHEITLTYKDIQRLEVTNEGVISTNCSKLAQNERWRHEKTLAKSQFES